MRIMSSLPTEERQRGLVSIYTVLLFTLVLTTVAVGFAKLMVTEQYQAMQDDLSKSAYNSAQAGVEDAKKAIMYCAGVNTAECWNALYKQDCPGFNATPFFTTIGIPDASATANTKVGADEVRQGYSCVIVNANTQDITGRLEPSTPKASAMWSLATVGNAATEIRIEWHNKLADNVFSNLSIPRGDSVGLNEHSPRQADWRHLGTGSPDIEVSVPNMLRASLIEVPSGQIALNQKTPNARTLAAGDITMTSAFFIPDSYYVSSQGGQSHILSRTNGDWKFPRRYADCDTARTTYVCSATLRFASGLPSTGPRYVVLEGLYDIPTSYRVTAYNGAGQQVSFDNVAPTIDATGYAGDVFRRVKARVVYGAPSTAGLSAAVNAGGGMCKGFMVGYQPGSFRDDFPLSDTGTERNALDAAGHFCPGVNSIGGAGYLSGN